MKSLIFHLIKKQYCNITTSGYIYIPPLLCSSFLSLDSRFFVWLPFSFNLAAVSYQCYHSMLSMAMHSAFRLDINAFFFKLLVSGLQIFCLAFTLALFNLCLITVLPLNIERSNTLCIQVRYYCVLH